jgi:hypothetical protein
MFCLLGPEHLINLISTLARFREEAKNKYQHPVVVAGIIHKFKASHSYQRIHNREACQEVIMHAPEGVAGTTYWRLVSPENDPGSIDTRSLPSRFSSLLSRAGFSTLKHIFSIVIALKTILLFPSRITTSKSPLTAWKRSTALQTS